MQETSKVYMFSHFTNHTYTPTLVSQYVQSYYPSHLHTYTGVPICSVILPITPTHLHWCPHMFSRITHHTYTPTLVSPNFNENGDPVSPFLYCIGVEIGGAGCTWPPYSLTLSHACRFWSSSTRDMHKKTAAVGGASWWLWIEWPLHLNFASYTHVLVTPFSLDTHYHHTACQIGYLMDTPHIIICCSTIAQDCSL